MAELSGFEVLALAKEIELALRGSYVNNIYSLGGGQLFRFRKPGGEDIWLIASHTRGVWVSKMVSERSETEEFTTRLRGELERARFARSSQVGSDRIFKLDFEGPSVSSLIVELMPPGNIIVADGAGIVRLARVEVRTPTRKVTRGLPYSPPGQKRLDPIVVTSDEVREASAAEKTAGKALGRHIALPRKYVVEVLRRVGLDEDSPATRLEGKEAEVLRALEGILRGARDAPRPCVAETPWGKEVYVVTPTGFAIESEAPSMSELCDSVFLEEVTAVQPLATEDDSKRRENEVTVSRLKSQEEGLIAEASKARESALKAAQAPSLEASLKVLMDSGVTTRKELKSTSAVASVLYDRAKELERKAEDSRRAAIRLERKAPHPSSGARRATRSISTRRAEWFEKFRWFHTSAGKLAIGGRDAGSNSTLVRRHLDVNDVVYHADLFGSPFFVLKGGAEQTEQEIKETAQATVAFSSAWKTGLGSADAYWVNPDQVGSAAPSGEFLPRGSFAIKGKKNFVNKNMVELALGLDSKGRVVSGPESAIREHSTKYVVLVPHREKASETAKKVMAGLGGTGTSLDEVLRALPSGGGKIVRRVGRGDPVQT